MWRSKVFRQRNGVALYQKLCDRLKLNGKLSRRHLVMDVIVIALSVFVSLYLRLRNDEVFDHLNTALLYLPLIIAVRIACLYAFNCYTVIWRYVSASDAVQIIKACLLSSTIIVFITFFVPDFIGRLPRAVYVIDGAVVTLGLMGTRLSRRLQLEGRNRKSVRRGQRSIIYGAGQNGRLLAHRFKIDAALNTHLVGFIDDDPDKKNMNINGVPVLGGKDQLAEIIAKQKISQVIIAMGNLPGDLLREITQVTREFNIRPRVVDSLTHSKNMEIYRDLELSDLLGRSRCEIDLTSVRDMIQGKRILVTGAGGSIGSELSRQIMSHGPARLLLLDNSEYNLYEIDKELRLSTHETEKVVPLLIDIKDQKTLRLALKEYLPEVVFHAAAYKHVHLVEANPFPSILNNVFATSVLLDICREINIQNFVMISTDKAVNPAGIMGATKRICELLVTMSAIETRRSYCSVRFGNVLGSSGSLIPLLKKQIAEGGPITITHPDMTRFFMLIPEAVSLVLKAATISNPGDISVLRMGEPVKILDVAKSLIMLMGKSEDEIPIIFTGLRPGEKMFEELYIRGDELKTEHPDILTLPYGDSHLRAAGAGTMKLREQITKMCSEAFNGQKQSLFDLSEIVRDQSIASLKVKTETQYQTNN